MWKDWRILASKRIRDWQEINWCYYWMNYLDKDYKSKDTGELEHLLIFEKENKQARIEVYNNWICFDVRKRNEKEQRYINIDRNEKELIERVKLTKRKQINELWAVSFVLWLWYKFVRDTFYPLTEE